MDYRLIPPKGNQLSLGFGALTYSLRPGSPLWVAIETDDLPSVQRLANAIVRSGVNIFSVDAAVPDGNGGVSLVNAVGLACEYQAVETAV